MDTCTCCGTAAGQHYAMLWKLWWMQFEVRIICACVQLLSKSLDQIKGEVWFAECGDAFVKHIPLYANVPEEKVSGLQFLKFVR